MDNGVREEDFSSQNVNISVSTIKESPVGYKYILSDGASFFIAAHHFFDRNIQAGDQLEEEDLEYLEDETVYCNTWRQALRYLEIRDHSSYELKLKLKKKDFPDEQTALVCHELKEKNLLNDRKFAENYLVQQISKNRSSAVMLLKKLAGKGIERSICDELLRKNYTEENKALALEYEVNKAMRRPGRSREQIIMAVQRKGFSYSDIINYLKMNEI